MKNKFFAILLAVAATFSVSSAAYAQGHGNHGFHGQFNGSHNGGWNRGWDHGNRGGNWNRGGWDRGGWNRGGWDRGYRNYRGGDFILGFGLGYLLTQPRYYGERYYTTPAPRYYYDAPVVAPAPQLYIDQYGREYYLDYNGYAVFTGRVIR